MTTDTRSELVVPSDIGAHPEKAGVQPVSGGITYEAVLAATVVGILAISALGMFVIGR